jgi:Mrp family chromosome partitioning ATPase
MAGEDNVPSLLHHMDENGVDVVTAGPQPPNAAELLTSGRLGLLITRLLDDYDHVLIDSPPVLGLADAPLIGSQVEAVVFTVESHGAKVGAVMAALSRLRAANANVIGAVLTKFEQRKAQYGYGFEYEYGYGGDRAVSKA